MKRIVLCLAVISLMVASCLPPGDDSDQQPPDFMNQYYEGTEMQFTFLVFDAAAVEAFHSRYQPLIATNKFLVHEMDSLIRYTFYYETEPDSMIVRALGDYSGNTKPVDSTSYQFAREVAYTYYKSQNPEYFPACLTTLFYHECLPAELRYKWHQDHLGHFEVNMTFFQRLRLCNSEFDEMCYGARQNHDSKLDPIFRGFITNEISVQDAMMMKQIIINNQAFDEPKFAADKALFLIMLEKVVNKEWRMIMIDWD